MASILTNANKDTAATSDALTGDVTLNVGGNFAGAIVYATLNPASGTGYTHTITGPGDYISITAKAGTTLSLNIEGGDTTNTSIDADLL